MTSNGFKTFHGFKTMECSYGGVAWARRALSRQNGGFRPGQEAMVKVATLVSSPANGLCYCQVTPAARKRCRAGHSTLHLMRLERAGRRFGSANGALQSFTWESGLENLQARRGTPDLTERPE
jgi:hypothetical protein